MGQYLMMCRYSWAEGVPADAPATKEEALAHIDHLYESGTPFFTKEAIRAIYEQFQRLPAHAYGAKVFAKDLTGATVEFQLEIGKTEQFYEEDDVLVKKVL